MMKSLKREYVLASVLLVIAVVIVFYQVVGHGFINLDDNVYVTENGRVQQGLTVRSLAWAFTSFHTGNWHPLTWLSHMLDFRLYGLNPLGHHLTNLLLHILNTVLLFLVFVRMTGSLWRSAFVAALFGIHPLHVESVAWASERKDVLSTLFWMLTMLAYVRYAEQPRPRRYVPVVVLFALGLMAKPMLVTLPFVLLLLDYWPLGRYREFKVQSSRFKVGGQVTNTQHLTPNTESTSTRAVVLEKVPLFILAAGSSAVTFLAQHSGGAVTSLERLSLRVRAANALVSYATYVLKMLWPAKLAVLYPHPQGTLPAWQVVGSAMLLVLITVFVIWAGRPRPYLVVGWLWYVGTLVPVIGLVQVGAQAMADRYTYVPLIGLFTAIAWGLPDLVRKGEWENGGMEERGKGRRGDKETRRHGDKATWRKGETATPTLPHSHTPILTVLALMAILALMARAWVQVGYWKESVTLLSRTIAITGDNYLAEYDLGNALVRKGRLDEAAGHYANAVRINPNHVKAHNNLANVLAEQGKVDEAAYHYSEALRLNPDDQEAHSNLGILLDHQGKTDEALAHLTRALSLDPGFAKGHYNLALILGKHGNITGAIEHLREAIRIQPDYPEAHNNLGSALASQGQMEQAISHFREAIDVRPDFAEAHFNLALALYAMGDYAGAWEEVRLTRRYGLEPRPDFLAALSRRMPEP